MMDYKKGSLLKNIKIIEGELKLEELSQDEMLQKIARYNMLTSRISQHIQTVSWKISQADFIRRCEDKKLNNFVSKFENVERRFEIPKEFDSECNVNDSPELMESLSARLEELKRKNSDMKKSISCAERELDALKKRNNSIIRKLMDEIDERENEERQLEHKLKQIQSYHETDNFDIYELEDEHEDDL